MAKTASVVCASCGAKQRILVRAPGRLGWECSACEARNVYGEGPGHAAIDASEAHQFAPEPVMPEGAELVTDGEEAGSSEAQA